MLNLDSLKALMRRDGLDAIVLLSPENVHYATGCRIITQKMIPDRMGIVLISLDDKPIFIVCEMERLQAEIESRVRQMRFYTEFEDDPIDLLGNVLEEQGLQKGRIGMEMSHVSGAALGRLTKRMRGARFRHCEEMLDAMRMIKSKAEIKILERAATVTEKSIYDAFEATRKGDSELDIAKRIVNNVLEAGADADCCPCYFLVIGSGTRTRIAHAAPTAKRIRDGELLRVDVGGMFSGYVSDIVGMAVVGKPTSRQTANYRKLVRSYERVIEAIRPGIPVADIYGVCKEAFRQNGLTLRVPHIGHSLGLKIHEAPMFQPFSKETVRENMILNIEPSVVPVGASENYHIEDTILVTQDGAKLLTDCQNELFRISS